MIQPRHRGVAEDDLRNRVAIAFFQPEPVTEASVRLRLAGAYRHESPEQIAARAAAFMASLATKAVRPPPGLSQSVDEIADPFHALGVHPDIVSRLWRLDRALPRSSRWVVWVHPALVHPVSGVIFAVSVGTLGIAVRLPPPFRDTAPSTHPLRPPQTYDVFPAGPEWGFLPSPNEEAAVRAAYEGAA